jgi:GDPmannose 4,6-dehydratase
VTRKITKAIARIQMRRQKELRLGNLESKRDWGYAPEYVEAMWLMLQQDKPDEYVIATGEMHTVQEFVEKAFAYASLWPWQDWVTIDPALFRPTEVDELLGDPSKAFKQLCWKPKVTFDDLVVKMVDADMKAELSKT